MSTLGYLCHMKFHTLISFVQDVQFTLEKPEGVKSEPA